MCFAAAFYVPLQVDELEGAEHFIPVSFEYSRAKYSSITDPGFRAVAFGGTYADWDASDFPIPGSEWDLPAVCYAPMPVGGSTAAAAWREEAAVAELQKQKHQAGTERAKEGRMDWPW